jgi:hypothetical protein
MQVSNTYFHIEELIRKILEHLGLRRNDDPGNIGGDVRRAARGR